MTPFKLLIWNSQGLGNPLSRHHLNNISKQFTPALTCILETKNKAEYVSSVLRKSGNNFHFVIDPVGRAGGIAIGWRDGLLVTVQSQSGFYVHLTIACPELEKEIDVIVVYLSTTFDDRQDQLQSLVPLLYGLQRPYVVGGILTCFFQIQKNWDMGFYGFPFTWNNHRSEQDNIKERLYRFLCSPSFRQLAPFAIVQHLDELGSDHRPILLDLFPSRIKTPRLFHFDRRWIGNDDSHRLITQSWQTSNSGNPMYQVFSKLKACRHSLFQWSRSGTTNSHRRITTLSSQLSDLKSNITAINPSSIQALESELAGAIREEEIYWAQKSRQLWLREGDKNTAFFHACTKQRHARKKLHGIQDSSGIWQTNPGTMKSIISRYYKDIFTTQGPQDYELITQGLHARVTRSMNSTLIRDVSDSEIKQAVFSMSSNKAPGDDGFTALFYQTYWPIIGTDICKAVHRFFRRGKLLRNFNHTRICLIPKVADAKTVQQLRPISLCTVFYKIISKVMTTRLKHIMSQIISSSQSAFLESRLISDNILVAHELMHFLKNRRNVQRQDMAIKLDLSKAYDRVEWGYLRHMLFRLGFHPRWVNWVMECVSTVSYTVLVNGEPTDVIYPSRGIRQGDPLSPYLFLLCSEGFSFLLQKAELNGSLVGIRIGRYCPTVSHLLFADDSLLFSRATESDCCTIVRLLQLYCQVSGQQINMDKSSVCFSSNTPQRFRLHMARILGITVIGAKDKYLGLPSVVSKSKKETFSEIKLRIAHRLSGWKEQMLSSGGKETLIKSVVTSIPVYLMSCFRLPKGLCQDINGMIARFWWSTNGKSDGIHWVSWRNMCKSKRDGGMGFRDIEAFNLALLAKQGWRLCYRVFKGRYFPNSTFLHADLGSKPSWAWRSIMAGKEILSQGVRWRIGNGNLVSCFLDPWIPSCFPFTPNLRTDVSSTITLVNQLIIGNPPRWNTSLLHNLFYDDVVLQIQSIPLGVSGQIQDKLIWHFTKKGNYDVKSGYHVALQHINSIRSVVRIPYAVPHLSSDFQWNSIWNLCVPPKIRIFLWRFFSNKLALGNNLNHRINAISPTCRVCGNAEETTFHLFFLCSKSRCVWFSSMLSLRSDTPTITSIGDWWLKIQQTMENSDQTMFAFILWYLWKARNALFFKGEDWSATEIVSKANCHCLEFLVASNSEESASQLVHQPTIPPQHTGWNPPPQGTIKLNFDAALNSSDHVGSIGVVCSNDSGIPFLCFTKKIYGAFSPIALEAIALLESLLLAKRMEFPHVLIEGDAKNVIDTMNGEPLSDSSIEVVIIDSTRLATLFSSCTFQFVKRTYNRMAHKVANKALYDSFLGENHNLLLQWLITSISALSSKGPYKWPLLLPLYRDIWWTASSIRYSFLVIIDLDDLDISFFPYLQIQGNTYITVAVTNVAAKSTVSSFISRRLIIFMRWPFF
ncbi:uncharacterized protein LOC126672846 [Mercurialis annua]|uniref:uncharacterized protein LOC126672846 n=1 Tax=Mercurialis annua TaxID=3986 RepID=UPI002160A832|nr:uncharacterized protein LOC126672846 [Mercurialis annua]